eukprot:TRINITY_DN5838_c0_g1_i1.p2 TRINITY_DN5838_c0_g1~~TRINITY_DN5838_c0_g1_i1.p2  ORF type:complete len:103 (-),score=14.00 TRINITY_DN5838_c0_g1_i1:60-368(-)
MTIVTALSVSKYIAIVLAFFGNKIFDALSRQTPAIVNWLGKSKIRNIVLIIGIVYILENIVTMQNAFEVFLNDELVFSGIQVGRLPSYEEIDALLRLSLIHI